MKKIGLGILTFMITLLFNISCTFALDVRHPLVSKNYVPIGLIGLMLFTIGWMIFLYFKEKNQVRN